MINKNAWALWRKKRNAKGRELIHFRRSIQEDGLRNIKRAEMHGWTGKIPGHFARRSRRRFPQIFTGSSHSDMIQKRTDTKQTRPETLAPIHTHTRMHTRSVAKLFKGTKKSFLGRTVTGGGSL